VQGAGIESQDPVARYCEGVDRSFSVLVWPRNFAIAEDMGRGAHGVGKRREVIAWST
jgi:hypothetical protein